MDLTIEALQKPCLLGMARIKRSVGYEMKIIIIMMMMMMIIIIIMMIITMMIIIITIIIIPESNIKLVGNPRRKIYPPEGTAILLWNWP